jgi:hypothetical protein
MAFKNASQRKAVMAKLRWTQTANLGQAEVFVKGRGEKQDEGRIVKDWVVIVNGKPIAVANSRKEARARLLDE